MIKIDLPEISPNFKKLLLDMDRGSMDAAWRKITFKEPITPSHEWQKLCSLFYVRDDELVEAKSLDDK